MSPTASTAMANSSGFRLVRRSRSGNASSSDYVVHPTKSLTHLNQLRRHEHSRLRLIHAARRKPDELALAHLGRDQRCTFERSKMSELALTAQDVLDWNNTI